MEKNITRNATFIGFTTVAALLGAGFAAAMTVSADTGLGHGAIRGRCDTDQHEAVEQALEDGDYDTWKDLVGDRGRIADVVNADNFNTFADMHEAMEEGDTETARELRSELGLGIHPADGTGFQGEMHGGRGMHGRRGH